MESPLHVSLDDLNLRETKSCRPGCIRGSVRAIREAEGEAFELDLGNLCVSDQRSLEGETFADDATAHVARLATEATRALLSKLSRLPRPRSAALISLPPPVTTIPRAKPLPTAKPLTRWEAFAKSKGIRKKKKDRKVWDEATGEWRRRYGYKRQNDPKDIAIIEAKPTDQPGQSPFAKLEMAKKERVSKQREREVRNAQRAVQKGQRLPASVRLVATLPKHGKGRPTERSRLKEGLQHSSRIAGLSTASMGKFDTVQKGEAADARISKKKKQTLIHTHELGEKVYVEKTTERLVKERSENALDVEKAMGLLEAETRRQRHQEKVEAALEGRKRPRSEKKRKGVAPLPKVKVTSRQKKLKRRQKRL